MNSFYGFIIAFCSVCLIISGLHILCPNGALEKAVKYILGLILIISIVTAIPQIKERTELSYETSSIADNDELSTNMTELAFKLALRNAGIQFSKITVCTDKNADGGIIIKKVTVHSPDSEDEISKALGGDDATYAIEVIYG